MSIDFITEVILQYRYWILIPLTFIEGPVVAFVAGTLAAVGYFNIYFLAILFFVRDVGLDGVYYAIGHFGARTRFVQRMLNKIGVTPDHLEQVRVIWEKRPFWTMFIGKLSYGIASAFIVVAGTVKMPLTTFFKYGSIVAVLQYGILLFAGYYLGTSFGGDAAQIINNVQYVIAFAAIAITLYYIFSWYMRRKFFEEEKEIA
ncbi:MAG: DedA protein [Parcubacteria group bacterium Gr01-1014_91]|nr:MAG: DedA protein [Parcubacteria group bacterium Gr01-1014_91]